MRRKALGAYFLCRHRDIIKRFRISLTRSKTLKASVPFAFFARYFRRYTFFRYCDKLSGVRNTKLPHHFWQSLRLFSRDDSSTNNSIEDWMTKATPNTIQYIGLRVLVRAKLWFDYIERLIRLTAKKHGQRRQ